MKNIILVTGYPASGTSTVMRMLEMGGVRCIYEETHREMKLARRNPYGLYETHDIPKAIAENDNCAIKALSYLKDDFKIILCTRNKDQLFKSNIEKIKARGLINNGNEKYVLQNIEERLDILEKFVSDKEYIKIDFDDLMLRTEEVAQKIKDFIPFEFNVEEAVKAVDKSLYKKR